MTPVALAAAQRAAERKRVERQVERNRAQLRQERLSYNAREKRKRDLGQASSDKNFVEDEKRILRQQFDAVAETRSKHLVEAHERFSRCFRAGRYEVVYPVLPMDILGLYVLLPETPKS